MLFLCRVLIWRDVRDSSNRISASEAATGRWFILNTNRVTDVVDMSTLAVPRCSFYYSDNPASRREGLSYIECAMSSAQVAAQFDVAPVSNAVTLAICPYNNPYKGNPVFPLRTPINTTLGIWSIAYVTLYNPDFHYAWVCYYRGSFKRMEVLVNIGDTVMYPTLTTTTTEEQDGEPL